MASLQQIWADAFDAWIGPFGVGCCIYMAPVEVTKGQTDAAPVPRTWMERWPNDELGVFSLTATDPMGEKQSPEANAAGLAELERELQELCGGAASQSGQINGSGRNFWKSFGFNIKEGWREDGFTVVAEAAEVIRLARKYRQGAIYSFELSEGASIRRRTVPVCLPDTEADVVSAPCKTPDSVLADPNAWGSFLR
ncbi:unnamed protein product [Cladocopium goreaui]|uniref:DUF1643 domain-containing protein n=1 Tax=Cladocopium goreaui TaxID=2562237 RepID=A0A9P1CDF5_9DINO|nr:unnamed protein product [Cladocopium goreaui]